MPKSTGAVLSDIYDAWRAQELDWLASYLPDDFCHVIHIPPEVYPLGGPCLGKRSVLYRLHTIMAQYETLSYDTSKLLFDANHAAVEVPVRCRHRQTGEILETTLGSFWTFEAGWPVRLTEYYDVAGIQDFVNRIATAQRD